MDGEQKKPRRCQGHSWSVDGQVSGREEKQAPSPDSSHLKMKKKKKSGS